MANTPAMGVPSAIGNLVVGTNNEISPVNPPGAIAVSEDGTIYRYCVATDSWATAGDVQKQDNATTGSYVTANTAGTAAGEDILGAALIACTALYWGFLVVYGKASNVLGFAVTGYTLQLAVCGGVTAHAVGNYAAGTHTAAGVCGVAEETKAAAARGIVTMKCFG